MPTDLTPPEAELREQVASWQGFYRQYLRAANGNEMLAMLGLIDLMISSGIGDAAAGTLAMAVRIIQEGPVVQVGEDAVLIEPIPGHPDFEDALVHMREGLGKMVQHCEVHFVEGCTDSEAIVCTYGILMKTLPRHELAGFLAGATTALAHLGWRP